MSNIPAPEEYVAMHKKAFRVAYDFLNAHFPPGEDDVWWVKAGKDLALAGEENRGNKLAVGLLIEVYEYLGKEWKRRFQNGKTEN